MDTIARIRREFSVRKKTIKEIVRELHVSRNTVRKVLRSGATSFEYERKVQPLPRIGPWRGDLDRLLTVNDGKPARERLTLIRIFEELRGQGYEGSYDAVRRYARGWRREQSAVTADAYVPLSFAPGEGLPVRLEPRDRRHQRCDDQGEGGARSALPFAHAVRAGLSAREPGDGLRCP
ncbi:mobile element protein [Bosea sp. BIWAKO-01]|nr:mobile element protein [Bosea sp. BIWAKO-01]